VPDVTVLRSDLRAAAVDELDDTDRAALDELIDTDPYANAVLASRLHAIGSLRASHLGGQLFGVRAGGGLAAAAFSGGNLLPVGGAEEDWIALAQRVAEAPRVCTSLVGRADAVHAMWRVLYPVWGPARGVRYAQPLLVAEHPPAVPVDSRVRPIRPAEIETYLPAAVAMFSEELGIVPMDAPRRSAYRRRVEWLIRSQRAFGILDADGTVVFKADIGAVSAHTCQVQGVWVRPDLRRRGIGTAALAAVIDRALTLAPSVSLYVNDFNEPARRMYARLGMREIGNLATVLI
jgi:predicted GNAT family acetyltransferase